MGLEMPWSENIGITSASVAQHSSGILSAPRRRTCKSTAAISGGPLGGGQGGPGGGGEMVSAQFLRGARRGGNAFGHGRQNFGRGGK